MITIALRKRALSPVRLVLRLPKISFFRPPPIHIFISLIVPLGVGKSQTGEISFKSARISPLKELLKMIFFKELSDVALLK